MEEWIFVSSHVPLPMKDLVDTFYQTLFETAVKSVLALEMKISFSKISLWPTKDFADLLCRKLLDKVVRHDLALENIFLGGRR